MAHVKMVQPVWIRGEGLTVCVRMTSQGRSVRVVSMLFSNFSQLDIQNFLVYQHILYQHIKYGNYLCNLDYYVLQIVQSGS